MSTGEIIKDEIKEILKSKGYSDCYSNVRIVYAYHLNDSLDIPIANVINNCSHNLKQK